MRKKIICPINFSDSSINALNAAAHLTKMLDAELSILYTYRLIDTKLRSEFRNKSLLKIEQENEALAKFKSLETNLEKILDINRIHFFTEVGFLTDRVAEHLSKDEVLLIVIGQELNIDFEQTYGNSYEQILNDIHADLLLVPKESKYGKWNNIVLAVDELGIGGFSKFGTMLQIRDRLSSTVHLLNIQKPGNKISQKENENLIIAENSFKSIPHSFHIIQNESVVEGINEYIEENPADLLVMVPHTQIIDNGIYSKRMARLIKVPLLTLQET